MVTDDTIRSLAISQHSVGTEEVILIQHTDCGMPTFTNDLRESLTRLAGSPFLLHKNLRGFVYDGETGRLNEVE